MSSVDTSSLGFTAPAEPDNVPRVIKTRELHVKGVPEDIWCLARCNATKSGMSFKDYLITVLAHSTPYTQGP